MKKIIKNNPSQISAGIVSLIIVIIVNWFIEMKVENVIDKNSIIKDLAIPISIAFGLIANIVIILNFDLLKRLPGIEGLMNTVNRQNKVTSELFNTLKSEQIELQKIYTFLHSKDIILKEFGNNMIQKYLEGFKVDNEGITFTGEHWSLSTYIQFWEYLANKQKQIKESKIGDNIIARITHSNDINIWKSDTKLYRSYSESSYLYQKKFTDNGGIIVRILLGEDDKPNDDYKQVMKKMEGAGIEAKYLPQKYISEKDFDFLFLADEGIVMKWFSGNKGQKLSKCTIVDNVENVVEQTWAKLYDILNRNDDGIQSIAPNRQHDL